MLRIFLISLLIIGCFSNFARNKWGFELRYFAEMALGISFLVEFVFAMVKRDQLRTKGERILLQIERVCIAFFFIAFVLKSLHWPAGIFYVLSLGILVIVLSLRLLSPYLSELKTTRKKIFFWSLIILFFCFWIYTYYMVLLEEFEGEKIPALIFAFIFSFISTIITSLFVLRTGEMIIYRNKIALRNFGINLFLLAALLLTSGILFKTMHWPSGGLIILFGCISLLLSLPILLLLKENVNGSIKNLFAQLLIRYPYVRFLYLYFGVWSFYIMLVNFNLAPRFYTTEFPYAFEEHLEAAEYERADKLLENYEALIEEIRSKTDSENQ